MKKIAVVGLGIIGGSLCKAFVKAGYFVAGTDIDEKTLSYALKEKIIAERAEKLSSYDTVFLAVPPRTAVRLLETENFKNGAFVADVCGVKSEIERAVYAAPRTYRYVGLHPMAGKETSGIRSASDKLFSNANLIITVSSHTDKNALAEAYVYAKALGFGRITECSAELHDKKIALTSQLAHIVSNAYVRSSEVDGCKGFTGGSFQDMTRIAGVDEKMWSQLYMFNRKNILSELEGLIARLTAYKEALTLKDENSLKEELLQGKQCREKIKQEKN